VQVSWGYRLYLPHDGTIVAEPMAACSGKEMLTELLGHLHFAPLDAAIAMPSSMLYITSQFPIRGPGDCPPVIPSGSTNLAFMGQFVEIPQDVVLLLEYTACGVGA
jgi:oleate hydratase